VIDLRSDWVTPPAEEMWEAMREARPEDLERLETTVAELLGKEAAVWAPTCSAANLAALLTHARPGDRVALQDDAHILTTEGMGITHVARLSPARLDEPDGAALVCLENTHTRAGGTVLSVAETKRLAALAPRSHLDGARLPNAAAAQGVTAAELAAPVTTVALSLNKGLGAPQGAVLAGPGAVIDEARVQLRRIGAASVHQAHVLAAAGLVALGRLPGVAEDNRRARELAERLGRVGGVAVAQPPTNIVLLEIRDVHPELAVGRLADGGVLAFAYGKHVRLVTHAGIGDADVDEAVDAVERLAAAAA
jgi:threonine aldolase